MLAGMDPNVLKSMSIDPKMLGLDFKALSTSSAASMNEQLLKNMGQNPKMLAVNP